MKKFSFLAMATVAAAIGFTACQSEVDMFETNGTGTIALNVNTTDNKVVARATVSSNATDWYVKVNSDDAITVAALASKAYAASATNTLTVYNYDDMATALGANGGRGAAYWTGTSSNFAIEAGKASNVTVNCGAAKNAAFSVVFNESFTNLVEAGYKVVASTGADATLRSLDFTAANEGTAYYEAGTLKYTLTATIGTKPVSVTKNIDITAGTNTQLTVKANSNGTITLTTIEYTEFNTDTTNEVTIDALTGGEVQ